MDRKHVPLTALLATGFICTSAAATDWIQLDDVTGAWSDAPAGSFANDSQEKDYAWGDLDQDGDEDLVIVRKQPFTSAGKQRNVLLMNEGGVLTDRTVLYAQGSDVPGDFGFNTPTNDRDVVLVDVNGDGWLDVVTAVTVSDSDSKEIGHPRIYINLGEDGGGNWQGLEYQADRMPQLMTIVGDTPGAPSPKNPRFCSVNTGDIDGDGDMDLYFGDYDSAGGGTGGIGQPFDADINDRLLINDGTGNFTDETATRFLGTITIPLQGSHAFDKSAFGAANAIIDMNQDGNADIVKQTALTPPQYIGIAYNNDGDAIFTSSDYQWVFTPQQAPYFLSIGDLNNDGMLDMVEVDDFTDKYVLAEGFDGSGKVIWSTLKNLPSQTQGFGGNSFIADLNNDGWNDIITTDVDVDIPPCVSGRQTTLLRNNKNAPNVTFAFDAANLSLANRRGVHDVAVFDINQDGWLDLVMGRCSSTEIYMNVPSAALSASYPEGQPATISADQTTTLAVDLEVTGTIDTATLRYSIDGGAYQGTEMSLSEGALSSWEATLPSADCGSTINYYVEVEFDGGTILTDPPAAPAVSYATLAAESIDIAVDEDAEGDVSDWTIVSEISVTAGVWEAADPVEVTSGPQIVEPEDDASDDGTIAFVTEASTPGDGSGATDVDGGATTLTSPAFDAGVEAIVSFEYWFFTTTSTPGDDSLTVQVSSDGRTWVTAQTIISTVQEWTSSSFAVSDFVEPTGSVQVRFIAEDAGTSSVIEAGIDEVLVESVNCTAAPCPTDLSGNGSTGAEDLAQLLGAWGPNPGHPADFNGSGSVGAEDLAVLLGAWGDC